MRTSYMNGPDDGSKKKCYAGDSPAMASIDLVANKFVKFRLKPN